MPEACTITNDMAGGVSHHAGHYIGDSPCGGHAVAGVQQTGSSKVIIQGIPAARLTDTGSTDCACCGSIYTNVGASSKVIIEGLGAVRVGDATDIHGAGAGAMVSGHSKVIMA